ncbi:MAG TPA: 16S rRNA (uracil(1498)-N(3))-methyltransferase [Pusillimonas sp.]|uniref:16S rRNA (uracil(1498)-N(3))-methyltransferase n=1 Tax=unclassified Pusillimonas TaxID=2640016 RepID=UPI0026305E7C|nr:MULTISPECIES: 16S rRNA (uracil(1498)-N(3))-methyltransferase [unclassified Pusillimonas]HLU19651.1 16S rRNA (uracil(1498)-N(3))-methyltransferase [Pusillimonas sp.]
MAAPRFFCPVPIQEHKILTLPPELTHYALRVLRLKDGASIILFDGSGGHYDAVLHIDGKTASAVVGAHHPVEAELPGQITLIQGLPSGDKMDWIIEKAVELGAQRLIPVAAQRSVVQLSPERRAKRLGHWQRIAQSASEQCGRNRILRLSEPVSLEACLSDNDDLGTVLLCHPDADQNLAQALDGSSSVSLLIGPEGGWSPEEQKTALRHGARPLRFGDRVLRTETAGLALIAAISALQGWV